MSVFVLKLFALIAMLMDHIAAVFGGEGWRLLPFDASYLRYIGRISFPIFAFCLVTGWKYTRSREKYFSRVLLFAFISQIPFSMAMYAPNTFAGFSGETAFSFRIAAIYIPVAILAVVSYWYFALKRKLSLSLLPVTLAALLPAFRLKADYIWILTPDSLNVLYTLALGLVALFLIEKVKDKELRTVEYIWLFILAVLLLSYGANADYGIGLMGVALIVALYLTQNSKYYQGGVIAIWGIVYYGFVLGNMRNAFATFVPAILILFYNEKQGNKNPFSKWLFYLFYPLHLLLIGLFNVYLK